MLIYRLLTLIAAIVFIDLTREKTNTPASDCLIRPDGGSSRSIRIQSLKASVHHRIILRRNGYRFTKRISAPDGNPGSIFSAIALYFSAVPDGKPLRTFPGFSLV
ncbi:hypothetical protein FJ418_15100 [Mesorhizobium sp. B2-8-3]|nr:hypothetical protein FJ418_15100 [Mesorhizobium sp. B2-8-3]